MTLSEVLSVKKVRALPGSDAFADDPTALLLKESKYATRPMEI